MSTTPDNPRTFVAAVSPVLSLEHTIRERTALRPSALMLPLSLIPSLDEAFGLPIVRGDRIALLYEAPRA